MTADVPPVATPVQTATGPVEPDDLGFCLMHEHLCMTWPPMRWQYPQLFDRDAVLDTVVGKLRAARGAGVRTIVDMTPMDLGRDVGFIREAAAAAGMQVVVMAGFYHSTPYYFLVRPTDDIVSFLVDEITVGISETGVRAGVLKCATQDGVDRIGERLIRAVARAHRETGVPISTHSHAPAGDGLLQQRILASEGVDLERVVIGHSDDSTDIEYLRRVMDAGSYCGMDRFGLQEPVTTAERVETVARLVELGYAERMVLSHDSIGYGDSAGEGVIDERIPTWRLTYLAEEVFALLGERGVSGDDIETMTVDNPRRIFSASTAY